jgi:predicted nuclease of predicted toxin-antitoxin system
MSAPKPAPPRLHLNEHLSPTLAKQLCNQGFDVTSSQEVGLLRESDDKQLAYAAAHQRAIVTFNFSDFVRLHEMYVAESKEHWGIILSTRIPTSQLMRRLLRLLHSVTAEELRNQLRWLNDFKGVEED